MQDKWGSTRPGSSRSLRRTAAVLMIVLASVLSVAPASALVRQMSSDPQGSAPAAEAAEAAAQTLTWTASTDYRAYASVTTSAVAGPATIVFETSDATGNTSGMQHTLSFDTTTPGYNHDVNINIVADPFDADQGRHEVQATLTPGKYRFFCAIPGHGTMTGELIVAPPVADTTAPVVTAALSGVRDAEGNYVGSATATLTATDAGSGVASVEYALDGGGYGAYTAPVQVGTVGGHTVNYRATDVAGNVSVAGGTTFTVVAPPVVDTTAPVVTAALSGVRDAEGNYVGSATATLTATDAGSGVASVEYALDGGGYAAYTAPVQVGTVGAHTVNYRATDVAGNVSVAGGTTFTVVAPPVADTTAPVVTAALSGVRDAEGNYVGSATATLTATDAGSGVASVEYALDGGGYAAYTAPVQVGTVGAHTVNYRATDVAGNVSVAGGTTFTVVAPPTGDSTAPNVTAVVMGNLNADWTFAGSAKLTLTATDADSGVASVEYSLDGGAYTAYMAPVTVTQAGAHTVMYRATDKAGNVSTPGTAIFTIRSS